MFPDLYHETEQPSNRWILNTWGMPGKLLAWINISSRNARHTIFSHSITYPFPRIGRCCHIELFPLPLEKCFLPATRIYEESPNHYKPGRRECCWIRSRPRIIPHGEFVSSGTNDAVTCGYTCCLRQVAGSGVAHFLVS
jgi:hypothetical protein